MDFYHPYNISFLHISYLHLRFHNLPQSSNISSSYHPQHQQHFHHFSVLSSLHNFSIPKTQINSNITSINMSTYNNNEMAASPSSQFDSYVDTEDLNSYARIMHEHTRKQMEAASRSARRRSGNKDMNNTTPSLPSQDSVSSSRSSRGSVSSTGSR